MSLRKGLVVFGLVIGSTAVAQERGDGKSPQERAQHRTDWMARELSLTEKQKTKVAELNLKSVEKDRQIRNDASLTADQKKAAWKENHQSQRTELKSILTADQLTLLKEKKSARHADMKAKHSTRKTPQERAQFRTDRLAKEVGLSEDQKTKVTALNLSMMEKNDAVRKNESLNKEQKEAAFKANRQEHRSAMKQVLTADQQKALKAKKQEHHGKHGNKKDAQPK